MNRKDDACQTMLADLVRLKRVYSHLSVLVRVEDVVSNSIDNVCQKRQ